MQTDYYKKKSDTCKVNYNPPPSPPQNSPYVRPDVTSTDQRKWEDLFNRDILKQNSGIGALLSTISSGFG